jgi:hypothetical protein
MKPCNHNRKLIALLVLEELEATKKKHILAHLDQCHGCRAYFDELSGIAGVLSQRKKMLPIEASEQFHASLLRQFRETGHGSFWGTLLQQHRLTFSSWRVALPIFGTAALVLFAILAFLHSVPVPVRPSTLQETASIQHLKNDLDPTISNYRMAADQSFERFNEMLTEQGCRNLAPTAIYTAAAKPAVIGTD